MHLSYGITDPLSIANDLSWNPNNDSSGDMEVKEESNEAYTQLKKCRQN